MGCKPPTSWIAISPSSADAASHTVSCQSASQTDDQSGDLLLNKGLDYYRHPESPCHPQQLATACCPRQPSLQRKALAVSQTDRQTVGRSPSPLLRTSSVASQFDRQSIIHPRQFAIVFHPRQPKPLCTPIAVSLSDRQSVGPPRQLANVFCPHQLTLPHTPLVVSQSDRQSVSQPRQLVTVSLSSANAAAHTITCPSVSPPVRCHAYQ